MPNSTSSRFKNNIPKIMNSWEQRAINEIKAAHFQETLALRNSLPEYLLHLSELLSTHVDRTAARKRFDKAESTRVGKKHGKERAGNFRYTMDQMILEYHILRQVICDVMEEEIALTDVEREVIVCSVEQAVNDAATEFSDTLKDLQEQMSQILAHDLRTPISAAKMSAQLLLKQPENKDGCVTKAGRIISCMDRIDGMITELLDVSKIRAGEKLLIDFKSCDLDWLVREVAYDLNLVHEDRLVVHSSGTCSGKMNEEGLRRLIENLATNALKYSFEKSSITISLDHDDHTATIIVHNQGEPIPLEEQSTLFHRFTRATTAENEIGWGLGLTMVKGMVDAHKGSITVESDKHKGTKFIIKLPKNPPIVSAEINLITGLVKT